MPQKWHCRRRMLSQYYRRMVAVPMECRRHQGCRGMNATPRAIPGGKEMRLIDADALKYRRKDYGGYDDVSDEERKRGILYLLEEDIAAVPTINPVKHGKWKPHYEVLEKTSEYVISASGYECSECGTIFHNQWDFCGNCGAVMEKVDEN